MLPGVVSVSGARHSGCIRDGLDGGGRFIPADIVGVHTLSLLISSRVAHDRAKEDNHTQEVRQPGTELRTELKCKRVVGTVHKPRQGGNKYIPLRVTHRY